MNPNGAGSGQSGSSESLFPGFPTLDVSRLVKVVRKYLWLAMAIAGGFVALSIFYVLTATKIYQSSAVIYVDPKSAQNTPAGISGGKQPTWDKLDALKSMAEGIRNGTTILRVVDALKLREDTDFLKPKPGGYSDAELVNLISKNVRTDLRRGTRLIDISVKDRSPVRAQQMAQAFIDEFQSLIREQNTVASGNSREMVEEEAAEQLLRVNAAEEKLQKFREANVNVPLDEKGGISETRLNELDSLLSKKRIEVIQAKAEYEQLLQVKDGEEERILDIGSHGGQDHIQKLLFARNQHRATFNRIKQQYEPGHQTYEEYRGDMEGLDMQVVAAAENVGQVISRNYERSIEEERTMSEAVEAQKRELLAVEGVRQEFRTLLRAVESARTTHQGLVDRLNNTDATDSVDDTVLRVFSKPLVPAKPIAPKKTITVAIAGVFGSMVGVAVVLGIGLLDRRLYARRQVESTLGIPVLAEIPKAFNRKLSLKDSLFVTRDPNSLVSEGIRALRSSLSAHTPRSVMITSASPGEGKSFCAANLALLQAQFGYKTLLVDADFRKPRMAEIFTDPLRGKQQGSALTTQNVCEETVYPNLFLLSCGKFSSESGEPMNGEIFASMLWEAYKSFDCVIVDTSPLGVVSDGLTYARHVDAVTVVVEYGATQTPAAQHVVQELQRMHAPLVGCILNGVIQVNKVQKDYMQTTARRPSTVSHAAPPAQQQGVSGFPAGPEMGGDVPTGQQPFPNQQGPPPSF